MSKRHRNYWTKDEILILGSGMPTYQLAEMLPGKTKEAIMAKRQLVYGTKYSLIHYSDEEKDIITNLWEKHTPVGDIIEAIKAQTGRKRSTGSIQQQVFKMGLKRNSRKTRLVQKFGSQVLELGTTADQIIAKLNKLADFEKTKMETDHSIKIDEALDAMVRGINAGLDRRLMFQSAMLAGATLQQVGARMGLTRERIRQVTSKEWVRKTVPVQEAAAYVAAQKELSAAVGNVIAPEAMTLHGKSKPSSYVKYNPKSGKYDYGTVLYNWDDRSKDELRKVGSEVNYAEAADRAAALTQE